MLQDDVVQALDAAFFRDARDRYGSDAWAAAVHEGAALSVDEAIAYALEEPTACVPTP